MKLLVVALILACGIADAVAADESLLLTPVYPAAVSARQSYFRVVNPTAVAGTITATVKTETGATLGTWTRSIAANSAPQVGMAEIEAALTTKPTASNTLRLEITSSFYGSVQHAVYNPIGQALTNVSNCGPRVIT